MQTIVYQLETANFRPLKVTCPQGIEINGFIRLRRTWEPVNDTHSNDSGRAAG